MLYTRLLHFLLLGVAIREECNCTIPSTTLEIKCSMDGRGINWPFVSSSSNDWFLCNTTNPPIHCDQLRNACQLVTTRFDEVLAYCQTATGCSYPTTQSAETKSCSYEINRTDNYYLKLYRCTSRSGPTGTSSTTTRTTSAATMPTTSRSITTELAATTLTRQSDVVTTTATTTTTTTTSSVTTTTTTSTPTPNPTPTTRPTTAAAVTTTAEVVNSGISSTTSMLLTSTGIEEQNQSTSLVIGVVVGVVGGVLVLAAVAVAVVCWIKRERRSAPRSHNQIIPAADNDYQTFNGSVDTYSEISTTVPYHSDSSYAYAGPHPSSATAAAAVDSIRGPSSGTPVYAVVNKTNPPETRPPETSNSANPTCANIAGDHAAVQPAQHSKVICTYEYATRHQFQESSEYAGAAVTLIDNVIYEESGIDNDANTNKYVAVSECDDGRHDDSADYVGINLTDNAIYG